jgi:hypothetical protein
MNTDESLDVLLKLVNGNKDTCLQLVQKTCEAYPGKSMQWCIQKTIYDLRFPPKTVKPNPKLNRWGERGGHYTALPTPAAKVEPAPKTKPVPLLPAPPPNITLATPQPPPQETVPLVLPDLTALAKAKRKKASTQPASAAIKHKLYTLTKDYRVSDRLVRRLQVDNPDRSEQWCYEKAIYDVERDRL